MPTNPSLSFYTNIPTPYQLSFFKELSKLGTSIPKNQEQTLKELWKTHGMEIVGPPLKF